MRFDLRPFYHIFNKNHQHEFLLKKEFSYFRDCKNILDIGCGKGDFIALDPKRIMGIDQNKKSVLLCRKKKFKVFIGEATRLPFNNSSFDGIHTSHIIEHLFPKDAHRFLKEVGRVLKKRGIFVLSTPILWKGFYNDFTHIKPYNPESIMRYLCDDATEKTLSDIPFHFELIDLQWRFRPFPLPRKKGYKIANFLYPFGIHGFYKDGYTLVLRKKK